VLGNRLVLVGLRPKNLFGKKEPENFWFEVASKMSPYRICKLLPQTNEFSDVL